MNKIGLMSREMTPSGPIILGDVKESDPLPDVERFDLGMTAPTYASSVAGLSPRGKIPIRICAREAPFLVFGHQKFDAFAISSALF